MGRQIQHRIGTFLSACLCLVLLGVTSCAVPQVSAEERLFLDLSIEAIDQVVLPMEDFEGTQVGGLSAIAYDPSVDKFYALSDDRQRPRFYTLALELSPTGIETATIETVTDLQSDRTPLDAEGMVLTPSRSLIVSSEGSPREKIPPKLQEFDLDTGQLKTNFRIPDRYLLASEDDETGEAIDSETQAQTQGIQENIGFESLTISAPGGVYEPYRLFAATEGPLYQDLDIDPEIPFKNRWLHYLIDPNQSTLLSEYFYSMDPAPLGAVINGMSEILSIDVGGHFLAIERAFGLQGLSIKLYQLATGVATDVSAIATLKGDTSSLTPIRKRLVADLTPLNPDNLEAMTLGPRLRDGSQSLIMVSDNNFDSRQETQIWLFKLRGV